MPASNHLSVMCNKNELHPAHEWTDEKNKTWFCFGGPFTQTQIEIKEQRDQNVLRASAMDEDEDFLIS